MGYMKRLNEERLYGKTIEFQEPTIFSIGDYIVTKKGNQWACSCKDYKFRKRKCKHIQKAKKRKAES